jgi:glycosyltransferase involved in cell wall biosynthesis
MENNSPFVSVIVPNYNHSKYLKQRLDSVFAQTYLNFEVILLDDCSTDSSREIMSQYANHPKVSHCVFNEKNSGNTFVQWNKGIKMSKGDYIWIAESDDYCDPEFLEELVKPIRSDNEIALAYCQSNRADESNTITGTWIDQTNDLDKDLFLKNFTMDGNAFVERFLIYRNIIPNASAVLLQKEAITALGYLDTDASYRHIGDWLFYLKLLVNKKMAFVSQPLNNFRYHSQSAIASGYNSQPSTKKFDITLKIRAEFQKYLQKEKPENYLQILQINKQICKDKKLDKVIFYLHNNQKIRAWFHLIGILGYFLKRRNRIKKQ